MATPKPHELTERITFINVEPPYGINRVGTKTSDFATVWARITEGGGRLEKEDQSDEAQIKDYEIWTQCLDGVTGFMQIEWNGSVLEMTDPPQCVTDGAGRAWLLISAQEVTERQV